MRKRKILFDELLVRIYMDGTIKIDGLNEFYNRKQRAEIVRVLKQISPRIIKTHLEVKNKV